MLALDPPLNLSKLVPGQCVIVCPFDLFSFESTGAYNVWMDNLLLRLNRQPDDVPRGGTLLQFQPGKGHTSQLWLTNVTMQGDGQTNSRAVFAEGATNSASIFACGAP